MKDTEYPQISLPSAPWVSSPGPVTLYYTLLITAMNGPLSQRMPFSSLLRYVFDYSCLKTWSWKGTLNCQPVVFLRHLKVMGQLDCHLLQPSGRRKVLSKNLFLLRIFVPSGSHKKLVLTSFHLLFSSPASLSGHSSQSFTQLFIILISILPFPSSHYLSAPPPPTKKKTNLTHHTPTSWRPACAHTTIDRKRDSIWNFALKFYFKCRNI